MLTFGPLTAFNDRTSQPLPGTPIQVFTLDGALVDTFTLDGAPLVLVSNARGYVGMFQADTTERVLVARARGGNDQPVYAHETLDEAADLTEIVNHGRLSEAELKSTFAHLDGDRLSIDGDPLGPSTVGITVDTSVGTRVFMGGVMVYGDTGWRDITSTATDALDPSNTGTIQLKREGNTVSLALQGVSLLPGDGPLVIGPLWQSFWPTTNRSEE